MICSAHHLFGIVIFLLIIKNIECFSSPVSLSISTQEQNYIDRQSFSRLSLYKDPNEQSILLPRQPPRRNTFSNKRRKQRKLSELFEKTNLFVALFRHLRLVQYKLSGFQVSLKHYFFKLWRFLCFERYTIYILQCEEGKYYIGSTKHRKRRYTEHFSKKGGSAWTRCYKPLSVVHEYRRIPQAFVLGLEAQVTAQYMMKYGIQNVRGAMFSQRRKFTRQRDLEALIGFLGHYNEMDYKGVRDVLLTKEFNNTFSHHRSRNYYDDSSNKNTATTVNDNQLQSSSEEISIWNDVASLQEMQKPYRPRRSH